MKRTPEWSSNGAPNPAHSMDKMCYQSRMGVSPTTTNQLAFRNTKEDGLRKLEDGSVMAYTDINGRAPTSEERGTPSDQGRMGAGGNSLLKR